MEALIFDCDGVIVDTERDGHRIAFNKAFAIKGIASAWGIDQYKQLVHVAGGKERMRHYFNQTGWPGQYTDRDLLISELHKLKTELFMENSSAKFEIIIVSRSRRVSSVFLKRMSIYTERSRNRVEG